MPIIESLKKQQETLTQWRRTIHQNPELAYEEFDTAEFVASRLEEWGIEVHRGIGQTGVVGVLKGKTDTQNRAISLRADMDALPMQEENTFAHRSKNDGKMHACGHDGHTTMLLGAAQHLAKTRDFDGTVNFIFQPAEEGFAGARAMIDDGLFDRFPCDAIYGLHNWPGLPVGHFSICEKGMMAASDKVYMTLNAKGGHGAMPHNNTDLVVAGAEMVMSLQTLVSRKINPLHPAVLTMGMFNAGSSVNVMPETGEITASVRSFHAQSQDIIEDGIKHITQKIAEAHNITVDVAYNRGYPSVYNNPEAANFMYQVAKDVVGDDKADIDFEPTMASEDFAFFLQEKKGAYIAFGQGENCPQLHNAKYDFNDETLVTGVSFWVRLTEMALHA